MVLGGLILRAEDVALFNDTIRKFREETKMYGELKWTKVSRSKLSVYKRFIDYFFALNNTDRLFFRCIIIDNHQVDHSKFSKGDKELGFYKFFYQLLLHCFGRYAKEDSRYIILFDERTSKYPLNTLKIILNRGIKKSFGLTSDVIRSVEARESRGSNLIQLADILMGAIGFQKNGFHLLAGSSQARVELANYIASQAGLDNLTEDTRRGQYRFMIWNFKLQPK
jgi:hypothetical protein